ncbi:superoxide dismutase [Cereibacter changlensis JA139]|uniref:Superoxide dismutase [Cu-Zn] n=2 Tax=Cereibacter changlensis TaxID=402884 RepID=A0A2T4K091_9RHOB|nr:superoxide dismutase family protein [Cereibacter changlensis]PTE23591.1 superoxide dismutase [Cereibacter changlensis JA139]PZX54353.1 Cu-Zn family superoxide dismutase [Cereibacter changlensis]
MNAFAPALAALLIASAAQAQDAAATATADANTAANASASFVDAAGEPAGSATLTGLRNGVLIELDLAGLPASQWVAFHVHETGSCDPQTGHESAGGHFNPTEIEHGYLSATGPHAGDMPNQYVAADGTLKTQVMNPLVTLVDGGSSIRGRALMIHGGTDDYVTQPSGDAGDRLACAVIE